MVKHSKNLWKVLHNQATIKNGMKVNYDKNNALILQKNALYL
jgi:hypothetical protein